MSSNSFGKLFTVTTFGESHGPAIGCVIDGCPPGLALDAAEFNHDLQRRATGKSRHTSARREADEVEILSGVYEGLTTGTPIALLIRNTDQRSKDYSNIGQQFRPGHADYSYWHKYGIRATPIAEAMMALVLMDQALRHRAQCGDVGTITPRIPGQLDG